MRLRLDATTEELNTKGEDLIKALVESLTPTNPELAESLEKALPQPRPRLRYKALRELQEKTEENYRKMLDSMVKDIGKVLDTAAKGPSLAKSMDFEKAEGGERLGHKYIKREGTPGAYVYTYADGSTSSDPGAGPVGPEAHKPQQQAAQEAPRGRKGLVTGTDGRCGQTQSGSSPRREDRSGW